MDVYEITGYETGVSDAGVNYLQPADSFQNIFNGFIYRQVLQSRQGVGYFTPRLAGNTRIFGIFEHTLPNSTKELLAVDTNHLYKYNTGTGVFDQIPFGGSMAAYAGFAISAKDLYVSGTSYPAAQFLSGGGANPAFTAPNQGARFVFTGEGINPNAAGSAIFFYNGTDVRDFTNVADNPNYVAPPQGQLTSATYVLWFNERLNFIIPLIAGIEYSQGVLYSGIRTANGNGDNFNVAGSGLFQADTYQNITGATILGQVLALNFDRMAYTLEKTRDAFNPYFGRSVPGVVGTNAKFSAVSWNDTVRSIGKVGILGQDGRQNLRVDNKIPNFTREDIDQVLFNLTYGGFDRLNNQFLWSYKQSETTSDTQNAVLVGNYEENTWSVFDQRLSVFGQTDIGLSLNWDDIDEATGNQSWAQWDTTEEIWDRIGLGVAVQKTLAGDDLGFIYELNQDFDDYFSNISAVANGATTTLTISATGILAGDLVTIEGVVGMLNAEGDSGINNYDPNIDDPDFQPYTVLSATPTSVTINLDSSLLTAYTSGGSISKIISFSAETIPFNPYRAQGRRCYVSHVEFLIECNGGSLTVDVFADQQQTPFKQNVLMKPTASAQNSEWLDMTVDQESNFLTFVLRQQSPAVQLRLTSMRIHCQPGGLTHG
jgi:hypothetical protein